MPMPVSTGLSCSPTYHSTPSHGPRNVGNHGEKCRKDFQGQVYPYTPLAAGDGVVLTRDGLLCHHLCFHHQRFFGVSSEYVYWRP